MKTKLLKFTLLIIFTSIFMNLNAYAYQVDIAKKYNGIFSSKILSNEDVDNYQQAYYFQENVNGKVQIDTY